MIICNVLNNSNILGPSCVRVTKSRLYDSRVGDHVVVHLGLDVKSRVSFRWGGGEFAPLGELLPPP